MEHECKWNEEKKCWRLVHPDTGDFIGEWYPKTMRLLVTKHHKTATLNLKDYFDSNWTEEDEDNSYR